MSPPDKIQAQQPVPVPFDSLQKFAVAVRQRAQHLVGCSGEQGLQIAVMAIAAQKAIHERKRLAFEADWFKVDSPAAPDAKPSDLTLAKSAGLAV